MSTDIVREITITDHVGGCLESFRDLTLALKGENRGFRDQIPLEDVEDEFGRFRVWSGNIGAHRVGRSSLDYRLRDASHIRQRVISLLVDLKEILQEAAAIIRGETVPWDCLSSDSNSDTEKSNKDVENEGVSGITTDQLEDTTELKQLHSSMVETVTLLLRLSMAIRNPAPHDQFMGSTNIDTSYYEEYDIMHVREKFPQAEEYLVTRLGRGISRRRQYLKYREAHHKKLKYGLEITETTTQDSKTEIGPQSTVASSLPAALKDVDYLDLTEDSSSEMGFSEASTAVSDTNNMNLRVPPLPEASQGGMPFECPLCFMIISVPSTRSWKHHVYKDLHPFICTAKHCTTPDRLFEDRNRWFEHEKEIHMRFWQCGEGCHETFTSKSSFEDHQRRKHQNAFTPNQLTAFLNIHERQVDANKTVECPLCCEKTPIFPHFRRHLGKHQEQLALFAVPSDLYQTKEEDDENEEAALDDEVGLDDEESVRSESDVNPQEEGEKEPPSAAQFEPVSEAAEDLVTDPSNLDVPTIHEEVITHYRHIDHGFEVATPTPPTVIERPPSPPSPSLAPLPPPPKDSRELQTKAKDKFDAADYSRQDRGGVLEKNEEDKGDKDARFRREEHHVANRTDYSDNNPLKNNEPDNEAQKGKTSLREAMIDEEEERLKAIRESKGRLEAILKADLEKEEGENRSDRDLISLRRAYTAREPVVHQYHPDDEELFYRDEVDRQSFRAEGYQRDRVLDDHLNRREEELRARERALAMQEEELDQARRQREREEREYYDDRDSRQIYFDQRTGKHYYSND